MARQKDLKVGDWVHIPGETEILCAQIAKIDETEDYTTLELRNIVKKQDTYLLRGPVQVEKLDPAIVRAVEELRSMY